MLTIVWNSEEKGDWQIASEVQNGQNAVIGISSCLIMDMHIINDDDQGVRERQSSLLITVDMYFYLVYLCNNSLSILGFNLLKTILVTSLDMWFVLGLWLNPINFIYVFLQNLCQQKKWKTCSTLVALLPSCGWAVYNLRLSSATRQHQRLFIEKKPVSVALTAQTHNPFISFSFV